MQTKWRRCRRRARREDRRLQRMSRRGPSKRWSWNCSRCLRKPLRPKVTSPRWPRRQSSCCVVWPVAGSTQSALKRCEVRRGRIRLRRIARTSKRTLLAPRRIELRRCVGIQHRLQCCGRAVQVTRRQRRRVHGGARQQRQRLALVVALRSAVWRATGVRTTPAQQSC